MDKSQSLRLGRPSTIPDWDITIPLPSLLDVDQKPVLAFFALWIRTAKCQGSIYELLYSPAAMAESSETRQSRVDFLASSLKEIDNETETTRVCDTRGSSFRNVHQRLR